MANDLVVVMGASEPHGTMPRYLEQLARAGIDTRVVGVDDKPNLNGGGNLGYRVSVLRRLAQEYIEREFMIVTDAFDVTFYGESAREVCERIPRAYLLHAAEKNCYPDPAIAPLIDIVSGNGPWRYANGGLVAGTPAQYLRWCAEVESHPKYDPGMLDQAFMNILVSEQSEMGVIDDECRLFQCLFGGYDELGFVAGRPVNARTGTRPLFVHANGKWDVCEMFDRHRRSIVGDIGRANAL